MEDVWVTLRGPCFGKAMVVVLESSTTVLLLPLPCSSCCMVCSLFRPRRVGGEEGLTTPAQLASATLGRPGCLAPFWAPALCVWGGGGWGVVIRANSTAAPALRPPWVCMAVPCFSEIYLKAESSWLTRCAAIHMICFVIREM
jgi:hypothetical protein